jgi:hypothetical protein
MLVPLRLGVPMIIDYQIARPVLLEVQKDLEGCGLCTSDTTELLCQAVVADSCQFDLECESVECELAVPSGLCAIGWNCCAVILILLANCTNPPPYRPPPFPDHSKFLAHFLLNHHNISPTVSSTMYYHIPQIFLVEIIVCGEIKYNVFVTPACVGVYNISNRMLSARNSQSESEKWHVTGPEGG